MHRTEKVNYNDSLKTNIKQHIIYCYEGIKIYEF